MKVYKLEGGEPHLVGRCDVPAHVGLVFEVPLFSAASVLRERYAIGTVTHSRPGGALEVERAVLLSAGQPPEILPGWTPLAS
jgi:hypothetical protein